MNRVFVKERATSASGVEKIPTFLWQIIVHLEYTAIDNRTPRLIAVDAVDEERLELLK